MDGKKWCGCAMKRAPSSLAVAVNLCGPREGLMNFLI
jgi:hypothetical protein